MKIGYSCVDDRWEVGLRLLGPGYWFLVLGGWFSEAMGGKVCGS